MLFEQALTVIVNSINAVFSYLNSLFNAIGLPASVFLGIVAFSLFVRRFSRMVIGSSGSDSGNKKQQEDNS